MMVTVESWVSSQKMEVAGVTIAREMNNYEENKQTREGGTTTVN